VVKKQWITLRRNNLNIKLIREVFETLDSLVDTVKNLKNNVDQSSFCVDPKNRQEAIKFLFDASSRISRIISCLNCIIDKIIRARIELEKQEADAEKQKALTK